MYLINQLKNLLAIFTDILMDLRPLIMNAKIMGIHKQWLCDSLDIFVLVAPFNLITLCIGYDNLLACDNKLSFFIEYIEVWCHYLDPAWKQYFLVLVQLSVEFFIEFHVEVVIDRNLIQLFINEESSVQLVCIFRKMHFLLESLHFCKYLN
jgi:hypothetical protein